MAERIFYMLLKNFFKCGDKDGNLNALKSKEDHFFR